MRLRQPSPYALLPAWLLLLPSPPAFYFPLPSVWLLPLPSLRHFFPLLPAWPPLLHCLPTFYFPLRFLPSRSPALPAWLLLLSLLLLRQSSFRSFAFPWQL